MESLRRFRRQQQRLSAAPMGYSADFARIWGPNVHMLGREQDMAMLPLDNQGYAPLQDDDGNLYFVVGISVVGGGDIIP